MLSSQGQELDKVQQDGWSLTPVSGDSAGKTGGASNSQRQEDACPQRLLLPHAPLHPLWQGWGGGGLGSSESFSPRSLNVLSLSRGLRVFKHSN